MSPGPPVQFARVAAVVLLPAAIVLYCAGPVAAACGDYVTVVGAHPSADVPGVPSPAPACHGPGCSKAPSQAAPVSAPKTVERPAPVGVAGRDATSPPGGLSSQMCPDPVNPSSRHPSDIFHPPRAV